MSSVFFMKYFKLLIHLLWVIFLTALTQVGGLKIIYNRRGYIIDIVGYVNYNSSHYNYNPGNGGHGNNYDDDDYGNDNDDDYYYYKKDGTKAKMSKDDIVEIKKK